MRKSLLALGVACMAFSSFASTRVLYSQNFEKVTTPEEAGWSAFRGINSIASDEYGKFFQANLNGQNCGTTYLKWGQDIFMEEDGVTSVLENGVYNLDFEFNIASGSSNQYDGAITVFTNHDGVTNQRYRTPYSPAGYWENFVFDMSQCADSFTDFVVNGGTVATPSEGEDGTVTYDYAIDFSDPTTFTIGSWYSVALSVDVNSRSVDYSVSDMVTGDILKSDIYTVPENNVNGDPISMFAEGLFLTLSRTTSIYQIDNIKVYFDSESDFANEPTVSLSRVGMTADEELDLNMRGYTISFTEGETLHVTGTNGQTEEVEYEDCDGAYEYETTTSGVLKAWTTLGTATSTVVEVEVDCAPVVLPVAKATISSVVAGFGKTYTLTVDNSEVPLNPALYMSYVFTGKSGNTFSGSDLVSGGTVTVDEEGTLVITTERFGYQSASTTVENNIEFETKKVWDFARMDKDELKNAGFADWTTLNSDTQSGFNNWTARKRLYYYDVNSEYEIEDGEIAYNAVYPFGFVDANSTTQVIDYCDTDGNETGEGYFDGLSLFAGQRVSMLYRIGLYNPDTSGGNYKNIVVNDLDETDFVVVNYINNYGGNSNHPVVADDDAYYAVLAGENTVYSAASDGVLNEETGLYSVTHALYRIDTACTNITVFKQNTAAVEGVEATEVIGDNNWYSIDGVRVAEPTRPGLYIHNGKKIIVK